MTSTARIAVALLGAAACLAVPSACSDAVVDVAAGATGGGVAPAHVPVACEKKYYACGDGLDNDDDGLVDAADPDCLGACDDSEDALSPNLPGDPGSPCKLDCFWDGGNGSGHDGCAWDHRCDPLEVAPDFPPEGAACAYDATVEPAPGESCADAATSQAAECAELCGPLTPNGCDCFGCCELPAGSGAFVWLGRTESGVACGLDTLDDPTRCPPCTPVAACLNSCTACELCAGRSSPDASCPPAGAQCPAGAQACGRPGQPTCPSGAYCVTGCCAEAPG